MIQFDVDLNAVVFLDLTESNLNWFRNKVRNRMPTYGNNPVLDDLLHIEAGNAARLSSLLFMKIFGGVELDGEIFAANFPKGIRIENPFPREKTG